MPPQKGRHSVDCWCDTRLKNVSLPGCSIHSVAAKSTPNGKIGPLDPLSAVQA